MKNRSVSINASLTTMNLNTGSTSSTQVGWFYFNISGVPEPNPQGNFVDPTSWAYNVLSSTPFTGQKEEWYSGQKVVLTTGPYGGGTVLDIPSWDRARLFNRALSKMNSKQPGANWSEDAAEARKTAKAAGLIGAAQDLNDVLTKKRAGIEGVLKGAVGFLSAGTLLTQFGLKPLVQNIFDTANVVLDNSLNVGYVASGSSSEPFDIVKNVTNVNSGSSLPGSVRHERSGKQGCRFKIWVKPDPNKSPTLDDFSTLNPYLLAWNLMPYSFLIDWAYNVSGYLEAMETAFKMASRFQKGYYTELYACDISEFIEGRWNSNSGSTRWFYPYGKAFRNERRFVRTKLLNWPLPNPPSLGVDLGSGQLASTAALLGNILGRTTKLPRPIKLGTGALKPRNKWGNTGPRRRG